MPEDIRAQNDQRSNPFKHMGQYYWRDAVGQTHGPFKHQREALFDLLSWAYPEYKPKTHWETPVLLVALFIAIVFALFPWWFG